MFGIFTKKKNFDLRWLGVDMHSHLLAGVDDGCKESAVSLKFLHELQELGLQKFFITPHIYSEIYANTADTLRQREKSWKDELLQLDASMPVENIHLAAEYMMDDQFVHAYTESRPLTLPGQHLLIEMSYLYERKDFFDQIFQMQIKELKPILAHPERYTFYHAQPRVFSKIKSLGCKLQLNLLSLTGYYGEHVRKVALQLVKEGLIDYVGTDLHHAKHLKAITEFARTHDVQKILANCPIKNQDWQ